ncbi:MAG: PD40 domain-containing protein [Anaerolineae bacterium]|nr:PD40 domain-containing protein [Anaerolineae bacterium]
MLGGILLLWALSSGSSTVNIGANVWSPDSNSLVFIWANSLYRLDIKTQILTPISAQSGDYREANWSPVDDQIVFVSEKSSGDILCLLELPNKQTTCPAISVNGDTFFPHWSPDGKRLGFYVGQNYEGSPSEYGYRKLVVTDFSQQTPLQASIGTLDNVSIANDLQWSPDGKQIAFVGFGTSWNIFIIDADGTTLQRFSDGSYDTYPTWSPDGKQIAFYSERDSQQNWSGGIYVQAVGTTSAKRLTSTIDRVLRMQWSPNGQMIAFATYSPEDNFSRIYLLQTDSSEPRLIVDNASIGSFLSWSPDNRFLVAQTTHSLVIADMITDQVAFYYPQRFAGLLPLDMVTKVASVLLVTGVLMLLGLVVISSRSLRNR